MCGIVGVLGNHEAAPLLIEALKRLEYRGYDSAGIATVRDGILERRRAVGKLVNLSDLLVHEPLAGKSGIGHTRWATHGAANLDNAHPHMAGKVAVVHNGIIENFRELQRELADSGYRQTSDTDTETIVLLVQQEIDNGVSVYDAVKGVLKRLEGAFALCFLFESDEDLLICARKGSPLAIGYGQGEMFVGSDAVALAPMTDKITYLEEGDWAVVTRTEVKIFNANDAAISRPITHINIDTSKIEKGGYKHFMAKEIADQPMVVANNIQHYVGPDNTLLLPDELNFSKTERLVMVGCGTAYYACHVAKYWFEQIAHIPCEIDIASEFRYRHPVLSQKDTALFISQSGETADTLAALRHCQGKVGNIMSVVNVMTSSIARESDLALNIHAGIEIGVASTKAFSCQLVVLFLAALKAAKDKGKLSQQQLEEHLESIKALPRLLHQTLQLSEDIRKISNNLAEARSVLFLGRGVMYPLALEGALKLKEISYIHAEGYAAGELKHGPIALIDNHVPVIVIAAHDEVFDKTVSNIQEVMARDGKVILVSDNTGIEKAGIDCWATLAMPFAPMSIAPFLHVIPAQLLAYHTAVARGTDVDQPRNLAKSVTVE